jgi:hypothetical protein
VASAARIIDAALAKMPLTLAISLYAHYGALPVARLAEPSI